MGAPKRFSTSGRSSLWSDSHSRSKLIQHNPQIANNLSGLGFALRAMAARGITMKYDRVHEVLGEGNFMLVVS
jgi:hypothetical protein